MTIFLDESGDLGWLLDKPFLKGGSSKYITIGGFAIENHDVKFVARLALDIALKCNLSFKGEIKGSSIYDQKAILIAKNLTSMPFQIISITADKRNVNELLRRDKSVFYNFLLNKLLIDLLHRHSDLEIILDNRTIRAGSRNSFEDCLRAKCWGELQLNTNISCRYEESHKNPGISLADWLANFIWRHYENGMSTAYNQLKRNTHFHEINLFT